MYFVRNNSLFFICCIVPQWDAFTGSVNINKIPLSAAILRSTEQGKGYLIYILKYAVVKGPHCGAYTNVK